MINPLLVPEIREMIEDERFDELRSFSLSNTPSVIADFYSALNPDEIALILNSLPADEASSIFGVFNPDIKVELIGIFSDERLSELVYNMPEDDQHAFLGMLQNEKKSIITGFFPHYEAQEDEEFKKRETEEKELSIIDYPVFFLDENNDVLENISIYKSTSGTLKKTNRIENDCWINLVSPTKDEIIYMSNKFGIPLDFFTFSLDADERSRIDIEDNAILIILRIPYFDEIDHNSQYSTTAMGIVLFNDYIITLCNRHTGIVDDFIEGRIKNFSTANRYRFLLQLLLRTNYYYLQYLKQMNNIINFLQNKILISSKNKSLVKIMNLGKGLVYFTTSLKSNEFMMIKARKIVPINEESENYLEEIDIENKQAIEMANIYSNIVNGMTQAFVSIISNNLNMIMKILTLLTITLTIPMIITSFYGMNIDLPFQKWEHAYLIVIGSSIGIAVLMLIFFRRKNWF